VFRGNREQAAVDVWEVAQMGGLVAGMRRIECDEQFVEEVGHVGAIELCVATDGVGELVLTEDGGVLGEEAEEQPGEEDVK
jgi:hypothetical protein